MDKKKILIITITILLIIASSIGGFILGQSFADKEEEIHNEINNKQDNNSNNNEEENNNIQNDNNKSVRERIEEIVENELKQLIPKKTLEELTNQDKLQTVLSLYHNSNEYTDTIQKATLENIFKNSSIRNLGIEWEDIYIERSSFVESTETMYEIENNIYKNVVLGGGAGISIDKIYQQIIDYYEDNNEITISYKYAFYRTDGTGPVPIKLYYTIEDALNDQDEIITYDPLDYPSSDEPFSYPEAFKAAQNHDFSKELDKLDTYTYTFEIQNNDIILIDFSRK